MTQGYSVRKSSLQKYYANQNNKEAHRTPKQFKNAIFKKYQSKTPQLSMSKSPSHFPSRRNKILTSPLRKKKVTKPRREYIMKKSSVEFHSKKASRSPRKSPNYRFSSGNY